MPRSWQWSWRLLRNNIKNKLAKRDYYAKTNNHNTHGDGLHGVLGTDGKLAEVLVGFGLQRGKDRKYHGGQYKYSVRRWYHQPSQGRAFLICHAQGLRRQLGQAPPIYVSHPRYRYRHGRHCHQGHRILDGRRLGQPQDRIHNQYYDTVVDRHRCVCSWYSHLELSSD